LNAASYKISILTIKNISTSNISLSMDTNLVKHNNYKGIDF
jgi:hypothetical protein